MKDFFELDCDLILQRLVLRAEGFEEDWGAGEDADQEKLPDPPAGVKAVAGNGFITLSWEAVPDAMYYNVYYQTSQGVSIKPNELTRPIASQDDFNPVIGVTKEKGNCIEGPFLPLHA